MKKSPACQELRKNQLDTKEAFFVGPGQASLRSREERASEIRNARLKGDEEFEDLEHDYFNLC
jgi:hypothetical protein